MEIWIVACAVGTLLVRIGLALYTCGLVRAKNAGGSLLRHVADLCLSSLAFWAVGIAVFNPRGESSWIAVNYLFGLHGLEAATFAPFLLMRMMGVLIATGVVVGALSERSRFWPSLAPAVLLSAIVVPLLARWCGPFGWIGRMHFHDLAGASFIHVAAGVCAATGAVIVRARNGKYNRDGSSNVIPGHSLPLASAGVMLILVGWFPYLLGFGFGTGSFLGMIALNTLLTASAAGLASLGVSHFRYGKPDIYLTLSGIMGGLVAATAGADVMSNLSAVATGVIAGVLVPLLMLQIDLVWRIDDPTGALVIHGVGGAWGILATGLLGGIGPGLGRLRFIGIELMGLAVVAGLSVALSAFLFVVLKNIAGLRSREEDEFDGLDLAEHDIGSYPDFQQTTIKSYHLREA